MNMVMIWAALIFSWKTFFYRWVNFRGNCCNTIAQLGSLSQQTLSAPKAAAASNWKGPLQNEKKVYCLALEDHSWKKAYPNKEVFYSTSYMNCLTMAAKRECWQLRIWQWQLFQRWLVFLSSRQGWCDIHRPTKKDLSQTLYPAIIMLGFNG